MDEELVARSYPESSGQGINVPMKISNGWFPSGVNTGIVCTLSMFVDDAKLCETRQAQAVGLGESHELQQSQVEDIAPESRQPLLSV